jgi:hypothetical protein
VTFERVTPDINNGSDQIGMIARLRIATRAFGTAAGLSDYSIRQDGGHVYRAAPRLKNLSDATTCAP